MANSRMASRRAWDFIIGQMAPSIQANGKKTKWGVLDNSSSQMVALTRVSSKMGL
jgi:hypothetical protein